MNRGEENVIGGILILPLIDSGFQFFICYSSLKKCLTLYRNNDGHLAIVRSVQG